VSGYLTTAGVDASWWQPPADLDCGSYSFDDYWHVAVECARALVVPQARDFGVTGALELVPGNGTAYRLVLGVLCDADDAWLAGFGRSWSLPVIWLDTGRGHVFDAEPNGVLHESYVREKLGGSISDAWVLSRFLTALRCEMREHSDRARR
jgi:hypothetical protein